MPSVIHFNELPRCGFAIRNDALGCDTKPWHLRAMSKFPLPPEMAELIAARDKVRDHYAEKLRLWGSVVELRFTLDGNLIGDLGEALALDLFAVNLVETKSTEGIDGFAADGRSVQVKATGTGRGPAFRQTETRADHLLFFDLDFGSASGEVVYNGPEHYAVAMLPKVFVGQRSLTRGQIRAADKLVKPDERLPLRAGRPPQTSIPVLPEATTVR